MTGYNVRDLMHRLTDADDVTVVFKRVEREVPAAALAKVSAILTAN